MKPSVSLNVPEIAYRLPVAVKRAGDSHLEPAQLGQPAQAAVARITGIRTTVQVGAHLVSVVGAHRNALATLLLNLQQGLHHLEHRHVALQMVVLPEVAVGIAARGAQMDEAHTVRELAHHAGQVVVGAHTERARAETKAVGGIGHRIDQLAEIVRRREDARETQNRIGRIVGMDHQPGPTSSATGQTSCRKRMRLRRRASASIPS